MAVPTYSYDPNKYKGLVKPNTYANDGLSVKPVVWGDPGASAKAYAAGGDPNKYSQGGAPIYAPERTSINTAYDSVKATGLIPEYKAIDFTPVKGLDQSYYDNLYSQASNRLSKQYFSNDDSAKNQLNRSMNQRGLVGSGVEAGAMTNLFNDYGTQLAEIGSNLSSKQAENDLDLSKFNTQGSLETAFKNRDYQSNLAQLGLSAAGDEARNQTEYDTKMFEQQIGLAKASGDQRAQVAETLQQLLGSQYISDEDKQNYGRELDAILNSILAG